MFRWFERLVSAYPEGAPLSPPRRFVAFMWECTEGLRPILLAMTIFTAAIGVFEAMLFAMLGRVVDWLAKVPPSQLWTERRGSLLLLIGIIAASPLIVALQTLLKQQSLAANFPIRFDLVDRQLRRS